MPTNEHQPIPFRPEPAHPIPLPRELTDFLQDRPFACLLHGTDQGTVIIVKAPNEDIKSCRGRVPILLRHEFHDHPRSPVIRTILRLFDDPERPLALESYTNIAEDDQREDFAALANQRVLTLLFYDEQLAHRLSKQVRLTSPASIRHILTQADKEIRKIKPGHFDFDRAKQEVMVRTSV